MGEMHTDGNFPDIPHSIKPRGGERPSKLSSLELGASRALCYSHTFNPFILFLSLGIQVASERRMERGDDDRSI